MKHDIFLVQYCILNFIIKRTTIVILIICSCLSCNRISQESDIITSKLEKPADSASVKKLSVKKSDEDSIPPTKIGQYNKFSFKFIVDTSGYYLKTIKIYSSNILIQEINTNKQIERKEFRLLDWNFDGNKDISVIYNCGSGGCAYWIWNYSPKHKKFIYNKKLSEVLGLELDTINRKARFQYKIGAGG